MKLIGKLKEKAEAANSKDEAKTMINEAGTQLTDEELEKAAGGAGFRRFDDDGNRKPK